MKILFVLAAAATLLSAADTKVGKPFTLKEALPIATVLAHPADYAGKTVQIKGKVAEVCQSMGCWMDLVNEDGQKIKIQVEHGVVEFPKDASGRMASAEGKLNKLELTREQAIAEAAEAAKDSGKKFDPASIKGPVTIYELEATGAVILSK